MASSQSAVTSTHNDQCFATTHWSVVLAAGQGTPEQAARALEKLCRSYWYPIYAYLRWKGRSPHDAEDLTQGFFAQLLRREAVRGVVPKETKFRSFLLVVLNRFLADEYDRQQAQKRGGGKQVVSFDAEKAEERYRLEPAHEETPDKLFDRRWAATVLDVALARLRDEFEAGGKAALFRELSAFSGDRTDGTYAEAAARLAMTEEAFKKAVQRLRRRYQTLIRGEIAQTVMTADEVDDEVRHLWSALGG